MIGFGARFALVSNNAKALDPSTVPVDNRSLRERMSFVANFSRLIRYYDHENREAGNWQSFFLKDPEYLLALISSTEAGLVEVEFDNLRRKIVSLIETDTSERLILLTNRMFDLPAPLFQQLIEWSTWIEAHKDDSYLKAWFVKEVERSIAPGMWRLLDNRALLNSMALFSGVTYPNYPNTFEQTSIWRRRGVRPALNPCSHQVIKDTLQLIEQLLDFYRRLIEMAHSEFDKRMQSSTEHPDTALMTVFLQLLAQQANKMNELSAKHLQLYYKKILGQSPRDARADSVLLIVRAKPNTTPYLPKGTLFNAGFDAEKLPVTFKTSDGLEVNGATISDIFRFSQDKGNALVLQQLAGAGQLTRNKTGIIQSWQLFRALESIDSSPRHMAFTIGSPELYLASGTRILTVKYFLGVPLAAAAQQQNSIELTARLEHSLLAMAFQFATIFASAKVRFSLADGWLDKTMALKDWGVTKSAVWIELTTTFEPTEPAVTVPKKPVPEISGEYPLMEWSLPMLSGSLAENPPNLLAVELRSDVTNADRLTLFNDHGALKPGTDIAPFGPIINEGSGFYVGSSELFAKRVTSFSLKLNWTNVPASGFLLSVYYSAYNTWLKNHKQTEVFSESQFELDAAVRLEGQWAQANLQVTARTDGSVAEGSDAAAATTAPLYLLSDDKKSICPETTLCFSNPNGPYLWPGSALDAEQKLKLGPGLRTGFIQLLMRCSSEGFGSRLYPKVLADIALQNAARLSADVLLKIWRFFTGKGKLLSPPNPPFVPACVTPSLSYHSEQTFVFPRNDEPTSQPVEFYHHGLFQTHAVVLNGQLCQERAGELYQLPLVEPLPSNRALYLGVKDASPDSVVTLYVQLSATQAESLQCRFEFLSETDWQELIVVHDGTDGFNNPGIIQLQMPNLICSKNPAMPPGLLWVRLFANNLIKASIRVEYIDTQAVMAERSTVVNIPAGVEPCLPPMRITEPMSRILNLDSVKQPFPSVEGDTAESDALFHHRVSKLIHNKARASSASDYASLIEMNFSQIDLARCVWQEPGRLEVAVVRRRQNESVPAAFDPTVSSALRQAIELFLMKRISPLVTVKVVNFQQLPVLVSAGIVLNSDAPHQYSCEKIAAALKLYLSPWIKTETKRADLDQGVTVSEIRQALSQYTEVQQVVSVKLFAGEADVNASGVLCQRQPLDHSQLLKSSEIGPPPAGTILVSNHCHNIFSCSPDSGGAL